MFNYKNLALLMTGGLLALAITSCNPKDPIPEVISEETYAGGELGTTFNTSQSAYEDPTPAVEKAGLGTALSTASISLSAPTRKATSLLTASDLFTSAAAASLAILAMATACEWTVIAPTTGAMATCSSLLTRTTLI